jgi:hypothetical protein
MTRSESLAFVTRVDVLSRGNRGTSGIINFIHFHFSMDAAFWETTIDVVCTQLGHLSAGDSRPDLRSAMRRVLELV